MMMSTRTAKKETTFTLGEAAIALPFAALFVAVCVAGAVVPFVFVRGLVGSVLWRWFAVPLGAPDIGIWSFAGLALLAHFVLPPSEFKSEKSIWERLAQSIIISPAMTLGLGWMIHWAMLNWQ